MVNSPLIRPYLLGGGSFGGGTLDSDEPNEVHVALMTIVIHRQERSAEIRNLRRGGVEPLHLGCWLVTTRMKSHLYIYIFIYIH